MRLKDATLQHTHPADAAPPPPPPPELAESPRHGFTGQSPPRHGWSLRVDRAMTPSARAAVGSWKTTRATALNMPELCMVLKTLVVPRPLVARHRLGIPGCHWGPSTRTRYH
jgi:hypothetical protein